MPAEAPAQPTIESLQREIESLRKANNVLSQMVGEYAMRIANQDFNTRLAGVGVVAPKTPPAPRNGFRKPRQVKPVQA